MGQSLADEAEGRRRRQVTCSGIALGWAIAIEWPHHPRCEKLLHRAESWRKLAEIHSAGRDTLQYARNIPSAWPQPSERRGGEREREDRRNKFNVLRP
jgi:hypothetical protein